MPLLVVYSLCTQPQQKGGEGGHHTHKDTETKYPPERAASPLSQATTGLIQYLNYMSGQLTG